VFSTRILLAVIALAATACDRPACGQTADSVEPSQGQGDPNNALGQPLIDGPENLKRLDPAKPLWVDPAYVPATGTEIEIALIYEDKKGRRRKARAQDWIHDAATGKAMTHRFVFAGSGFWQDEQTGKRHYLAESGDFICVSNFSSAMLDVPVQSSQGNDQLMFKAFTKRIPPLGTPVTMILTPKRKEKG